MVESFDLQGEYDPQAETVTISLEGMQRIIDANNEGWAIVNKVRELVGPAPEARFDDEGMFLGFSKYEHRTVGTYRAWSHEASEWCYPDVPCRYCDNSVDLMDLRALLGPKPEEEQ